MSRVVPYFGIAKWMTERGRWCKPHRIVMEKNDAGIYPVAAGKGDWITSCGIPFSPRAQAPVDVDYQLSAAKPFKVTRSVEYQVRITFDRVWPDRFKPTPMGACGNCNWKTPDEVEDLEHGS